MTDASLGSSRQAGCRVVLVESSEALPGLFPFQAWDALGTADLVYVRDVDAHPSAPHLYFAGLELATLEAAPLEASEMDLTAPGSAEDRRVAKALLTAAAEAGVATYLAGPEDERLSTVLASMSPRYDAELELVFFAQQPPGTELLRLVEVMRALRDPESGCPWDLQQDHASLAPYLIEEVYELLDAIDSGWEPSIREELGDVLLQVVFHAQVAADAGAHTIDDVARGISDKLVRRHPHVFAEGDASTPEEVQANWDELKAQEKAERGGPFEGIPLALPALQLAQKLQRRAAKLGFAWPDADGPADKVREELEEALAATSDADRQAEVGDLLGAVVALARHLDVDAEDALRQAARRFRLRFEAALTRATAGGREPAELSEQEWLEAWDHARGGA